jgi:hypothetical protein
MSEKKRQKKDGGDKNKKNQAMHARENDRVQTAAAPQQGRDASNLTDTEAGAADSNRRRTKQD